MDEPFPVLILEERGDHKVVLDAVFSIDLLCDRANTLQIFPGFSPVIGVDHQGDAVTDGNSTGDAKLVVHQSQDVGISVLGSDGAVLDTLIVPDQLQRKPAIFFQHFLTVFLVVSELFNAEQQQKQTGNTKDQDNDEDIGV